MENENLHFCILDAILFLALKKLQRRHHLIGYFGMAQLATFDSFGMYSQKGGDLFPCTNRLLEGRVEFVAVGHSGHYAPI